MILKQNSLCDILFHVKCFILKSFSVLQIASDVNNEIVNWQQARRTYWHFGGQYRKSK